MKDVDDLLRRVAAELDAGRPAGPLIENVTLRTGKFRGRHDIDAIHRFPGQFPLSPGQFPLSPGQFGLAGSSADPWRDLPVAQLTPDGVSSPARLYALSQPRGRAENIIRVVEVGRDHRASRLQADW